MSSKYDWLLIGRIEAGGYRVFRDEKAGRFALADNSGETPDRTEDDVLWLDDLEQELVFDLPDNYLTACLRLVGKRINDTRVFVSVDGALWMSWVFGMPITFRTSRGVCFRPAVPKKSAEMGQLRRAVMQAEGRSEVRAAMARLEAAGQQALNPYPCGLGG